MTFAPTPAHAQLFGETLDYLKQSDLAAFIIDQLAETPATITVVIGGHVEKNTYMPGEDLGGTIRWNPFRQVRTKNEIAHRRSAGSYDRKLRAEPDHLAYAWDAQGDSLNLAGELSPAMLLMHEMGHAYQRLSDHAGFRAAIRSGKQGVARIENVNVNAIENTVALELRAQGCPEGVRWRYGDIQGVGWFQDKRRAYQTVAGPFPGWASKHLR
jgi:hypothetical protein